MSPKYTIHIEGLPIDCDSAESVVELVRAAKQEGPVRSDLWAESVDMSVLADGLVVDRDEKREIGSVLELIKRAGDRGILGADLASVVNVNSRGVGGYMSRISNRLESYGFEPSIAFRTERRPGIGTRWFANAAIDRVIEFFLSPENTDAHEIECPECKIEGVQVNKSSTKKTSSRKAPKRREFKDKKTQ